MSAQTEDGFLGARPTAAIWTIRDTRAQASGLRGLLAYYGLTHRPAAIFAAMSAADRLLSAHPADPTLIFPFTRLYQATGDVRYLTVARQQARIEGSDGMGLCALYEATSQAAYLQAARRLWAKGQASPALSAELLLLTGRPGYAAALNHEKTSGPEMLRAAWTRLPYGIALSTGQNCTVNFSGVRLTQQTPAGKARSVTVTAAKPTAFTLQLFVPSGPAMRIRVNGVLQKTPGKPGRYVALVRRWRTGDVVMVQTAKSPASQGRAAVVRP